MSLLREFERHLEGAVEGLFARAFRSGVQPVELGKRVVRELEDSRAIGVRRTYVANVYELDLSPADRRRFADYEQALTAELAQLAVQTAREHDWGMLGPARVEFRTGHDLIEGRFRVSSRVEALPGQADEAASLAPPARDPGPATAMLPGEIRPARTKAPAALVLLGGAEPVVHPLEAVDTSVGRSPDVDVQLTDPGVSRRHLRVVREGDNFIVEDLNSTNGTEVNGRPVQRRRLAHGDRVRLGTTTLEFRRRS